MSFTTPRRSLRAVLLILGLLLLLAAWLYWRSPTRRVRALVHEQTIPGMSHDISLFGPRDYDQILRDLRAMGPQAIPPLLTLLKDPHRETRRLAAMDLGDLGDRRAVPPLIVLLDTPPSGPFPEDLPQVAAAQALGKLGDPASVPALLRHLADPSASVGGTCAAALGRIGDRSAVPHLIPLLRASRTYAGAQAAIALGELRDPSAIPALQEALQSPDLASNAAYALAQLGQPDGLPLLLPALKPSRAPYDREFRTSMIHLLGTLHDPRLKVPLDTLAATDPDPEIRKTAVEELRQYPK